MSECLLEVQASEKHESSVRFHLYIFALFLFFKGMVFSASAVGSTDN